MKARRTEAERGSMLLIVFVFAAIVAISLYMEMPVAVFEARRQKEQVLVDRGNEYAHAVQLYFRKFGRYPPTIEALENTNDMRFLRHKFKDPFTGEDDWRLLHAGPGGIIIDSKVKPLSREGQNTASVSADGDSIESNTTSTTPDVAVAAIPQRPPAVPASGSGEKSASSPQSPMTAFLETEQTAQDAVNQNLQGTSPNPDGPQQVPTDQPEMAHVSDPTMRTGTDATAGGPNPLTSENPLAGSATVQAAAPGVALTPGTPGLTSTMGSTAMVIGGIAGVASKAGGHTIKRINNQDDYSMWEFYYDILKDAARQLARSRAAFLQNQNHVQDQSQTTESGQSSQ